MYDAHRRDTSVLAAALGRDWPSALDITQLPHDPANRAIKPPASRNPATRIVDDPRSLGQLFSPSPFQQVEALNAQVDYAGRDYSIQAARYRRNPAMDAADVQSHVVDQTLFSGWTAACAQSVPEKSVWSTTWLCTSAASIAGLRR